jgi:glycosyltransferase involved in cell wall biosynthesis
LVIRRVLAFCRYVSGIIAPSSIIKHYLVGEGIQTPIKIIPSGLLPIFLAPDSISRPIEQDRVRLLTVGRMVKEKNIESLLRVAARLAAESVPFTLTLVGYGAEYEPLKSYAYQDLKLSTEQVVFVHQPPKDNIVQYYRASDVFLFSSHTDTQGIVLAEAMASGVPVIAFDGPGQRDIIVQGENGYIVADEQAMVEQIKHLYAQPAFLARLSHHAYLTAQRYRPDVLVQRLIDFYEQVD